MLGSFHTLYLETTRECNYSCEHCSSGSHLKKKHWGQPLSYDQIIQRVLLPAFELGTRNVDFSGGEFLLRKDAFDLIQQAAKIGFMVNIVTNGAMLNDSNIKKIKELTENHLLISLGINSFNPNETYDPRLVETDKTLKLIRKLEKEHIRINICVSVGKHTADDFAATTQEIKRLCLPYNRIPFTPRHSDAHHLMFDKEILKTKIHPSLRKHYNGYMSFVPLFLPEDVYHNECGQSSNQCHVPTNPSVGCWVGSFYSVTPEGNVAPCPLLGDHVSGGNVLKEDLNQILFHSDLFTKIVNRRNLGGKCGTCKYNFTCGGCRTMAYYKSGDVFAEDPTCFIDDLSEHELNEMERETIKNFKNYKRMAGFGGLSDQ